MHGLVRLCVAVSFISPLPAADFETDIAPVLESRCLICHSGEQAMAGLRLDRTGGAFEAAKSGSVPITKGDSAASELVRRVSSKEDGVRMPPSGDPLTADEVEGFRQWIDAGADWPESWGSAPAKNSHWAFEPLSEAKPPEVANAAWVRTPVDRFILARLEAKGLKPAPEASRRVLARRLSFGLAGLPPSPESVDAFERNSSPDAYDQLADQLLQSPRYGERWARHWLDVVRYADSEGYENDIEIPLLHRYRDWVIRSLNDDLPFDRFVQLQVAGDEFEPDNPDAMVATGLLTAGPRVVPHKTDTAENKERYYYDELDDIVQTVGQGFLGMTVGCARCHDHKYDPIPSRDYYRMAAVFGTFERLEAPLSQPAREHELWLDAKNVAMREHKMDLAGVPEEDRILLRGLRRRGNSGQDVAYEQWDHLIQYTPEEFDVWLGEDGRRIRAELAERAAGEPETRGWIALDSQSTPIERHLLAGGQVTRKVEPVEFGFLTAAGSDKAPAVYQQAVLREAPQTLRGSTYQRSALARWLVDVDEGAGALLARVIVNRIWQRNFGEGLVRTPNDFGLQGELPTHPELLDFLARELIANGWRLKPIQRMIVQSAAYRMGTDRNDAGAAADPENKLLWHRRPIRLEAEILRDNILAVAGSLDLEMYGPGVRPVIPDEAVSTRAMQRWPKDLVDGPEQWRRTVYLMRKRSVRMPLMDVFDAPDENVTCGRRVPTITPTQALALLNDTVIRRQARFFAERVREEAGQAGVVAEVERAYQLALGRAPSAKEGAGALAFITDNGLPLTDFCHTLLTLNEFLYVD